MTCRLRGCRRIESLVLNGLSLLLLVILDRWAVHALRVWIWQLSQLVILLVVSASPRAILILSFVLSGCIVWLILNQIDTHLHLLHVLTRRSETGIVVMALVYGSRDYGVSSRYLLRLLHTWCCLTILTLMVALQSNHLTMIALAYICVSGPRAYQSLSELIESASRFFVYRWC